MFGQRPQWSTLEHIRELVAEENRYTDIAIRFRVRETGQATRVYGGVWDVYAGCWVPRYRYVQGVELPNLRGRPRRVRTYWCSRAQLPFILSKSRRVFGKGGRGGGKSHALALRSLLCLIRHPTKMGQIVSPTFRKSRIIWRKLSRLIPRRWLLPGKTGIQKAARVYAFVTGAWIQFMSADEPSSLRGEDLAWVGIDETQDVSREAWDLMFLSLRDAGAHFSLFEVGTPQLGEMYRRYLAYKKDPHGKVFTFRSRGNPFIDHTIFDDAANLMDARRYRQEVEAEFVAQEGVAFPAWDTARNVVPFPWKERSVRDVTAATLRALLEIESTFQPKYLIGIDYGEGVQHAVVYLILAGELGPVLWAIAEYEFSGTARDLGEQMKRDRFFPAVVVDDASGRWSKGGNSSADLEAVGYEVYHPSKNPRRVSRVNSASAKVRSNSGVTTLYVDPACERLIMAFESQTLKNGVWDKTQGFDHILDAATYPIHYLWPSDEVLPEDMAEEALAA